MGWECVYENGINGIKEDRRMAKQPDKKQGGGNRVPVDLAKGENKMSKLLCMQIAVMISTFAATWLIMNHHIYFAMVFVASGVEDVIAAGIMQADKYREGK